jgi:general secretion pathway protein J
MNLPSRRTSGFTLIELLVAVFISAIMFALGYAALGQVIAQRERVQSQQRALDELQRTLRVMTLDFAQAAARPVRDPLGRGVEPALLADARNAGGVSLTRSLGAPVLAGAGPALQRIEWRLEDGALVRTAWSAADRTQTTPARRRVMREGVRAFGLRFLGASGEWVTEWPGIADRDAGLAEGRLRPRAVEITLDDGSLGIIRRVIEVGG